MGRAALSDDNGSMALKPLVPTLAAALAALSLLAAPPSASAVGVANQQVVSPAKRATRSASTMIAPVSACPAQTRLAAPVPAQLQAMRCMTAYARERAGLAPLAESEQLDRSAGEKSGDVLRCDSFSHYACGREFTYWMEESGYLAAPCWRAGENLAWGLGQEGTVRSIFRAWMRSPGHRQNVLGSFAQIGVGLRVGTLSGREGTRVWTQHFGSRCETSG